MLRHLKFSLMIFLFISTVTSGIAVAASSKLTGDNVLILYKTTDDLSKKIAEYYAKKRHVPASQIIAVDIIGNPKILNRKKFEAIPQLNLSKVITGILPVVAYD